MLKTIFKRLKDVLVFFGILTEFRGLCCAATLLNFLYKFVEKVGFISIIFLLSHKRQFLEFVLLDDALMWELLLTRFRQYFLQINFYLVETLV